MALYLALRVHRKIEHTNLAPGVRLEEIRISLQPLPTSFSAENEREAMALALSHYPTFRSFLMVQEKTAYDKSLPLLAQCGGIYELPHPTGTGSENSRRRERSDRHPHPIHRGGGKSPPRGKKAESAPSP